MDEEEQQRPMPYQSPMYNFGSSIIVLTSPNEVIRAVELGLRGLKETESGELIQVGQPLMNDEGIGSVIGSLTTIVNRNTIMSNLEKEDVTEVIMFTADTIIQDLMVNRMKYGIKSPAARQKIYYHIIIPCLMALKRGWDEGDKRFLKGSVQEIYSKVEQQKPKGLLSSLNPFAKG